MQQCRNDKDRNIKRAVEIQSPRQSKWLYEESNKEILTNVTNLLLVLYNSSNELVMRSLEFFYLILERH